MQDMLTEKLYDIHANGTHNLWTASRTTSGNHVAFNYVCWNKSLSWFLLTCWCLIICCLCKILHYHIIPNTMRIGKIMYNFPSSSQQLFLVTPSCITQQFLVIKTYILSIGGVVVSRAIRGHKCSVADVIFCFSGYTCNIYIKTLLSGEMYFQLFATQYRQTYRTYRQSWNSLAVRTEFIATDLTG